MASDHPTVRGIPLYVWAAVGALVAGALALISVLGDWGDDPMALLRDGADGTDATLPFIVHCACLLLTPILAIGHVARHHKDPHPAKFVGAVFAATTSAGVAVLWLLVYAVGWLVFGFMGVR